MEDKDSKGITSVLEALKRGYETGDFSILFPYLSDDCAFDTSWRRFPIVGKDAVSKYFFAKGNSIAMTKAFPECQYVSETDETESKTCKAKYALRLTKTLGKSANTAYAHVTVDNNGLANRILLVDPLCFECENATMKSVKRE